MSRHLDNFLDALARGRRPRRRRALDGDAMRIAATAAAVRAARSEAATPTPEFVDGLASRLRDVAASEGLDHPAHDRRRFLAAAAFAGAAALGGAGIERLLTGARASDPTPESRSAAALVPDAGSWQRVAALEVVRTQEVVRFEQSGVTGYVLLTETGVAALSAVCTHLGCLLAFKAADRRLHCPCHASTAFGLDGSVSTSVYQLAALPRLGARINGLDVEVLLPKNT